MNKIISSVFVFLFAISSLFAQIEKSVSYEVSINRISDTEAEVLLTMEIGKGWHVYSAYLDSMASALPTVGYWNDTASAYSMVGGLIEPEAHEAYDENFQETLRWHSEKVIFRQKFIIHSSKDFSLQGEIAFMACNDRMCLPPEYVEIDLKVKGAKSPPKK